VGPDKTAALGEDLDADGGDRCPNQPHSTEASLGAECEFGGRPGPTSARDARSSLGREALGRSAESLEIAASAQYPAAADEQVVNSVVPTRPGPIAAKDTGLLGRVLGARFRGDDDFVCAAARFTACFAGVVGAVPATIVCLIITASLGHQVSRASLLGGHIGEEAAEPLGHCRVRDDRVAQARVRHACQHRDLHHGHDLAGLSSEHRET
jgi:hypothetical protein